LSSIIYLQLLITSESHKNIRNFFTWFINTYCRLQRYRLTNYVLHHVYKIILKCSKIFFNWTIRFTVSPLSKLKVAISLSREHYWPYELSVSIISIWLNGKKQM
jgi:hypothetical protein